MTKEEKVHNIIRSTIEDLGIENSDTVFIGSKALLPTRFGNFNILGVHSLRDMKDHAIIIQGNPIGKRDVPLRIHSECLTGDAFTSLRCDCRQQLEFALEYLSKIEHGLIIYLRQEGRGIGLFNKLKAYTLQDQGYDTYEANELLGFKADERRYEVAVDILKVLDIDSVTLITNNPLKADQLCEYGIEVNERIPIVINPTKYNKNYLKSKEEKGHLEKTRGFGCPFNE